MSWGCAVQFLILMECCLNFFINFLNIEIFCYNFCLQYFMFYSRFMLFPTYKKMVLKKIPGGGGGGCRQNNYYRVALFEFNLLP